MTRTRELLVAGGILILFMLLSGVYLIHSRNSEQSSSPMSQTNQESTSTSAVSGPPKNPSLAEQKAAAAAIADLKCPEDYQNEYEVIKAFGDFFYDYSVANPDANGNIKLLDTARVDFLISHHCTQTLMNMGYTESGPITPAIRQHLIDSYLSAAGS